MTTASGTEVLERELRASPEAVQSVARAVTGEESAVLGRWSVEVLVPGAGHNPTAGGLVRVAGTARLPGCVAGTARLPGHDARWSAVLEVLRSPGGPEAHDSPGDPICWRRELKVARSGLLTGIAGIRAPRCYRVDEPDARTGRLWLEDLGRLDRQPWREADYRRAARSGAIPCRHLGLPGAGRPDWLDRTDFLTLVAQAYGPMIGGPATPGGTS